MPKSKSTNNSTKKASSNIEDEWMNFISNDFDENDLEDEDLPDDLEDMNEIIKKSGETLSANLNFEYNIETPKANEIYISTKTKIAYLNQHIDLKDVFWKIPVLPYPIPSNGVIKKQMKFNSSTIEDYEIIQELVKKESYYEENVITSINNPAGRIKFKDIRKVSIGISKKDIMSYRSKKKSAFYNCFVIILRLNDAGMYKEIHVKVFNTGKLEIPGIQNERIFNMTLSLIIDTLQPHISDKLEYKSDSNETVLINSNFNCGFFIDREILYDVLRYKYNIHAIYDPCSYPGIQCKFYYNPDIDIQLGCQISEENKHLYKNINEISFMIFRTGSVLIVGKCDENVLMIIYEYLKIILNNEFKNICQKNMNMNDTALLKLKDKNKKKKIRKKIIIVDL
uniref:Uncharacterized protein n=1 Tax=viral metagenome TaxID=1070528 RepID=A0A6C0IEU3_9ZZZZ